MTSAKKEAGGGAIERAVAHFSAQEVRTIEVPEWGDDNGPLLIYVEPFTLREQGRLHKSSSDGDATVLAEVLIMKCMDAEGNKMFDLGDKRALQTKVDAGVLARVATDIMAVDPEEIEKN
tara:strand:- start:1694 stop:2053 length:360 start_codon:yes stop_codon:yes gene_type:complete